LELQQVGVVYATRICRAIFDLLNFAFQLLTGMFVPLQVLPTALRAFGIVALPQSFGMDLLRHYVMGTRTVMAEAYEWAILGAQFVIFGLLARLSVRSLERSAREEGLHYL
jgi:ABC-2 type transport system permease protein